MLIVGCQDILCFRIMIVFIQKLSNWYFTKRALPYWCVLILDCLCVLFVGFGVHFFSHGMTETMANITNLCKLWAVYLIPVVLCFRIFHTYSSIVRYSSFVDLQRLGFATFSAFIITVLMQELIPWPLQGELYRKSGLFIIFMISTGLMWMMRVVVKFLYDVAFHDANAKKIFVYGVHHGGISIAKSVRNAHKSKYCLDGFVSADDALKGSWMMGVRVYQKDENLINIMLRRNINTLMVSPLYNEDMRKDTDFVDKLIAAHIHILMLPPAQEWDGKEDISHTALREVNVEDLLPRAQIEIDMNSIAKQLTGKNIMITGAAGSIGSEIVRQVASFAPAELTLIDQAETPMHDIRLMMKNEFPKVKSQTIVTSICNQTHMEHIFVETNPDYVFHAAAYKHVPMMEDNPAQAVQNNVYGTRIIADLAVKYNVKKFVMISTDKAVNPTNVMGCSKRICEIYVQSLDKAIKEGKVKGITQFVTTRFGNVLGSNGSVIPLFREQIKNGGPLTVTHPDIIRFFMLIPEACKLVLEAGTMGNGGEIFVFDMGQPVKIADLAKRMIELSGVEGIEIKYTGLRDGEKLYEEVLNDAEQTKPTHNPKIMVASVRQYDYKEALANEKRLYEASFNYDDMATVKIMKEIVPEFKSKHSKYEALDN